MKRSGRVEACFANQSLSSVARWQARKISCVELTKLFLERIHALADELNCFITVTEQLALEQARAADHLIATSAATPLTGIPMVHKDLFCTQGVKTTCGSRMLDNFIAPYDATIVQRVRQAGMVMLGKTNMDEFAMGSSNEKQPLRGGQKPVGQGASPWWFIGWIRSRCCCPVSTARNWDRYRRLSSTTGVILWHYRA